MTKPRSFAPIIAAILLLLPVLYVGSYLALVVPKGQWGRYGIMNWGRVVHYRNLTEISSRRRIEPTEVIFWPLEQIDRRVRPGAWEVEVRPKLILRTGHLPFQLD